MSRFLTTKLKADLPLWSIQFNHQIWIISKNSFSKISWLMSWEKKYLFIYFSDFDRSWFRNRRLLRVPEHRGYGGYYMVIPSLLPIVHGAGLHRELLLQQGPRSWPGHRSGQPWSAPGSAQPLFGNRLLGDFHPDRSRNSVFRQSEYE